MGIHQNDWGALTPPPPSPPPPCWHFERLGFTRLCKRYIMGMDKLHKQLWDWGASFDIVRSTRHLFLLTLYNSKNIGMHIPPSPHPPCSVVPVEYLLNLTQLYCLVSTPYAINPVIHSLGVLIWIFNTSDSL